MEQEKGEKRDEIVNVHISSPSPGELYTINPNREEEQSRKMQIKKMDTYVRMGM